MLHRYLYFLKKKQCYFFLKPSRVYHLNKKIRINGSAFFFKFDATNIVYSNSVYIHYSNNVHIQLLAIIENKHYQIKKIRNKNEFSFMNNSLILVKTEVKH